MTNLPLVSMATVSANSGSSKLMSGVSTLMMDLLSNRNASFTWRGCTCQRHDHVTWAWPSKPPTSSEQYMRAMASESRIMLSSCLTVILHEDLVIPGEEDMGVEGCPLVQVGVAHHHNHAASVVCTGPLCTGHSHR